MDEILGYVLFVLKYGWGVIPIIGILLLIAKPERIEKLKEVVLFPLFRLFKVGTRQYIAATVAYAATSFLQENLRKVLKSIPNIRVKIRWVTSDTDPILKSDGSLLICLRETDDQTRNIIAATQATLPHVIFPGLRPQVDKYAVASIDLTILRKLSLALGKYAYPTFARYFLGPLAETDDRVRELFGKLAEVDNSGTFVAVLLEEMNQLSELAVANGDQTNRTDEVVSFIEYLLEEARRGPGEEIRLGYSSRAFKVGMILLAKSWKAQLEGVRPYLNRLDRYIRAGFDSIYVIAYSQAFQFYGKLLTAIQGDARVNLVADSTVAATTDGQHTPRRIALFRRVPMFVDQSFLDKATSLGLTVGSRVRGKVLQAAKDHVLVDVLGLNGMLLRRNCSWSQVTDCSAIFEEETEKEFVIAGIDAGRCQLLLTGRTEESDPWRATQPPGVGQRIQVEIYYAAPHGCRALTENLLEVFIPRGEIDWQNLPEAELAGIVGSSRLAEVISHDAESRLIIASATRTTVDPWPAIVARYPPGTTFRGRVIGVDYTAVQVRMPGGEVGLLPRSSMLRARFEYTDFEKTVVIGQGLDVVVKSISTSKRKIRLELQRNLEDERSR